jgi:hypothetical protein
VRALLIVRSSPSRQRRSGVIEIVEDRLIEQFVPHVFSDEKKLSMAALANVPSTGIRAAWPACAVPP